MNCAVCCYFVSVFGLMGSQRIAELVRSVTGWNTSVFELMKVAERAVNMAQAFNFRQGLRYQDDNMPERFFTPQPSGPIQGIALDPEAFQKATETYYEMMGWVKGKPSPGKLGELGISWVAPLMPEQ